MQKKNGKSEKVKTFMKEHRKDFVALGTTLGYGMIGYVIGWHYAKKTYVVPDGYFVRAEPIKKLLAAIDRDYPEGTILTYGACDKFNSPISISDLGKVGEFFKDAGASENDVFTHILAVGPDR